MKNLKNQLCKVIRRSRSHRRQPQLRHSDRPIVSPNIEMERRGHEYQITKPRRHAGQTLADLCGSLESIHNPEAQQSIKESKVAQDFELSAENPFLDPFPQEDMQLKTEQSWRDQRKIENDQILANQDSYESNKIFGNDDNESVQIDGATDDSGSTMSDGFFSVRTYCNVCGRRYRYDEYPTIIVFCPFCGEHVAAVDVFEQ